MPMSMPEIEDRVMEMLKENSRITTIQISRNLGISRATAKKALENLVDGGRVLGFTIRSQEERDDLALLHLEKDADLPQDMVLERFELIDGTWLALIYLEKVSSIVNRGILDVKIIRQRIQGNASPRSRHLHCDYCHAEILGSPLKVKSKERTYFVCCPNCKRDMERLVSAEH